jgi:hypothetical protein
MHRAKHRASPHPNLPPEGEGAKDGHAINLVKAS